MNTTTEPKFGDIFFAILQTDGNVQGGKRPVLIAQNDIGNRHSPTVEIIPLTANVLKAGHMPTHVFIEANAENGLAKNSVVLAEQVRTVNKTCLRHKIGRLRHGELVDIGRARSVQSPFPIV